jgi:[citrate (pro-3S)-lyase] ligase
MELSSGSPFRGAALEKLKKFITGCGLKYDERVEYSICFTEDDNIVATGSLDGAVLKCVAVSPERKNEGLVAGIVSGLVSEAARRGRFHLFLFTKPANEELFGGLGFYPVAKTSHVLLMENKKQGVQKFASSLKEGDPTCGSGPTGAIVVNCNPFTRGHLYLVEAAARQCGLLYLFVVSENKSRFPAEARAQMVRLGTAHLPNVRVYPTGPYLVSSVTFPDYFLKDSPGAVSPEKLNTELDLVIFAECFARPLGISRRYVGSEPLDEVTGVYNKQMKEALPLYGIEVIEIRRLEDSGGPLSASRVRRLLDGGGLDAVRELVPPTTYDYLARMRGREVTS